MFKNSSEIFDYIKKNDVKLIDVRFIDLPGIQHHFNVPVESFDESVFKDGLMFDGSSIRGFQSIHESDMKLLPVPSSAYLDPFRKEKTLIILFSVHNPDDNSAYSRDPRGIVNKAVEFMRSTGIAEESKRMQMALQTVDIEPELREDISQSLQLINLLIFAMRWL